MLLGFFLIKLFGPHLLAFPVRLPEMVPIPVSGVIKFVCSKTAL
jgi:hypothetical protein